MPVQSVRSHNMAQRPTIRGQQVICLHRCHNKDNQFSPNKGMAQPLLTKVSLERATDGQHLLCSNHNTDGLSLTLLCHSLDSQVQPCLALRNSQRTMHRHNSLSSLQAYQIKAIQVSQLMDMLERLCGRFKADNDWFYWSEHNEMNFYDDSVFRGDRFTVLAKIRHRITYKIATILVHWGCNAFQTLSGSLSGFRQR